MTITISGAFARLRINALGKAPSVKNTRQKLAICRRGNDVCSTIAYAQVVHRDNDALFIGSEPVA